MTTTDLLSALDEDYDPNLLLIIADCMEEEDKPWLAKAFRQIHREGREPRCGGGGYYFYYPSLSGQVGLFPNWLSKERIGRLKMFKNALENDSIFTATFKTRREAFQALAITIANEDEE